MRRLWITAIAAFALDQASKLAVIHLVRLPLRGEVDVIDPLLNLRWAENRGINFGLFAHDANAARWVLIALALAISAWVVHWARREGHNRWTQISAGLLVGGALGNVVDRLAYGYVADFLNMSCCGIENPYAFNIADVAIAAGAMGLVLFSGGSGKAPARKPRRKTP